jgi:hypothetical protein
MKENNEGLNQKNKIIKDRKKTIKRMRIKIG